MSTNVPINRMTVTSMPTATIPLVPIDAPAIPGTKETEQAAIFVSFNLLTLRYEWPQFVMILVFRILYLSVSLYEAYNFGKYIFFNMSRSWIETKMEFVLKTGCIMTPYSLAPVQMFSSLFSMHTVWCCQGNLFENQELYKLVIIFFIPMILMFGSAVIRWGEIKCQTLLGVKGLRNTSHLAPNLPPPPPSQKRNSFVDLYSLLLTTMSNFLSWSAESLRTFSIVKKAAEILMWVFLTNWKFQNAINFSSHYSLW